MEQKDIWMELKNTVLQFGIEEALEFVKTMFK
jgi:hypothetical protein